MSRFFRQAGDSDSESESSDDELMSSGEDEGPQKVTTSSTAKPAMARFLKTTGSGSSDSDEDEDSDDSDAPPRKPGDDSEDEESDGADTPGVRIKSASERRLEEMKATGKMMENAIKINDWVAISSGTH